jgi:hypothetical protein
MSWWQLLPFAWSVGQSVGRSFRGADRSFREASSVRSPAALGSARHKGANYYTTGSKKLFEFARSDKAKQLNTSHEGRRFVDNLRIQTGANETYAVPAELRTEGKFRDLSREHSIADQTAQWEFARDGLGLTPQEFAGGGTSGNFPVANSDVDAGAQAASLQVQARGQDVQAATAERVAEIQADASMRNAQLQAQVQASNAVLGAQTSVNVAGINAQGSKDTAKISSAPAGARVASQNLVDQAKAELTDRQRLEISRLENERALDNTLYALFDYYNDHRNAGDIRNVDGRVRIDNDRLKAIATANGLDLAKFGGGVVLLRRMLQRMLLRAAIKAPQGTPASRVQRAHEGFFKQVPRWPKYQSKQPGRL